MMSLRTRLAVLSATLSGAVILLLAYFVESYIRETLMASVDLKLVPQLGEMLGEMRPDVDPIELESRFRQQIGGSPDVDRRLVLVRDDFENRTILSLPVGQEWVGQIEEEFWRGTAEEQDRLASMPPRPPAPGANVDAFLANLLGEGQKGAKKGRKGGGSRFPPKFMTATVSDLEYRFAISRARGYSALVGVPMSETQEELRRLRRSFLLGLPIALLCIAGGGWIVATHALKPVRKITSTVKRITASDLDERVPSAKQMDTEFSELVEVLNGMIARLEQSFSHANRFSADVSHELKTPIAIMQGQLDNALKHCEPGAEMESELLTVQGEVHRLKSIINSLMMLSQADAGELSNRRREQVSLTTELGAICEDAEILCETAGLQLDLDIQPGMKISTNRVLFHQAMQNLISNAVKYNEEGGKVTIAATMRSGRAKVLVSNTGPGIPEADQKEIFERFRRGDKSRSRQVDGFGLGLNLAQEIFRSLGGDLRLIGSDESLTVFEATVGDEMAGTRTTLLFKN